MPCATSWLDRPDGCVLPLGFDTASVAGMVQVPSATEPTWSRDRAKSHTEEMRWSGSTSPYWAEESRA